VDAQVRGSGAEKVSTSNRNAIDHTSATALQYCRCGRNGHPGIPSGAPVAESANSRHDQTAAFPCGSGRVSHPRRHQWKPHGGATNARGKFRLHVTGAGCRLRGGMRACSESGPIPVLCWKPAARRYPWTPIPIGTTDLPNPCLQLNSRARPVAGLTRPHLLPARGKMLGGTSRFNALAINARKPAPTKDGAGRG